MKWIYFLIFSLILASFAFGHDLPLENNSSSKIETKLLKNLHEKGIEVTLKELENYYKNKIISSNDCHIIAHYLGRESQKLFGTQTAVAKGTHVCRAGFYHGLFESVVNESKDFLLTVCFSNSLKTEALRLQCLHGLGHGVMAFSSNYETASAIDFCKSIKEKQYANACASGVFMEALQPGLFTLNPLDYDYDTPFEFCENQDLKENCYLYTGLSLLKKTNNDYEQSLDKCNLTKEYSDLCKRGIGVFAARNFDYEPKKVYDTCNRSNVNQCIFGAASEYGLSLEITKGIEFCNQSGLLFINCYLEFLNSVSKHL